MSRREEEEELARVAMEMIDQAHRRISRYLDLTRVRVLGLVADQGPARPSAIAAALRLSASTTSRHLTALQQAGQIAIEVDPTDARTFLVRQTEAGRGEVNATVQAGIDVLAQVIADWSDEDVTTARVLIARLNQAWAQRGEATVSPAVAATGPRWRRSRRAVMPDEEDGQ